jgi:1-acyl-sn-glycerol-3-phosphate acyltransferase
VHVDPDPIGSGRDPEFLKRVTPLLDVYTKWYRPEVRGFESLPAVGEPFLLAGNHNGGATPPDLPILLTAWWRERGYDEPVYGLFHSFFLSLPGVGTVMSKTGALDANPVDAPEGTMARPWAPLSRNTSTSTVGLPRESRTWRPTTCSMLLMGSCCSCC